MQEILFERLNIDNKFKDELIKANIFKPVIDVKNKIITIKIDNQSALTFELYHNIFASLQRLFEEYQVIIDLSVKENYLSVTNILAYLNNYLLNNTNILANQYLITLDNEVINIMVNNDSCLMKLDNLKSEIKQYFFKVGIINEIVILKKEKNNNIEEKVFIKKVIDEPKKSKDYTLIKDLIVDEKNVEIIAKVFKMENIKTRRNKIMQILTVYDDSGAFVVKRFEGYNHTLENIESIKIGSLIKVVGDVQYDSFSKNNIILANRIEIGENPPHKVDSAKVKRVELHSHTNKSEMDGVVTVEDLIDYSYNLGHKAVAITDHMVVQAFPDAYNHLQKIKKSDKDADFKILYGVEFNAVDDYQDIILNYQESEEINDEFIIFDLETTGLSVEYDKIIEFGAVKIRNNSVVEKLAMFINPQQKLSQTIINLTKITQNQVDQALTIEHEIDNILDFIKDTPLVAHNASFDIGFLNKALERLNKPKIKNVVIDTMLLSRILNPARRYHSLGSVARFYNISYDNFVAHRADYDAEVLANVFLSMKNQLGHKNITKYSQIQALITKEFLINSFASHVNVLVKNQEGLKDVFKLVSKSHTDSLAIKSNLENENADIVAEPRLLKSDIFNNRKNLLIGSSCQNGFLFEIALNKSQSELEEEIKLYDYIEVMPKENYRNLVERYGFDKQRIELVLINIIKTAKKLNKIVVAVGDSHYLTKQQKEIRDIYINANGVGGVRHPLYIRNKAERLNSISPDQHFRDTNEMLEEFSFLDEKLAYEIVVLNTNKIADSIDDISPLKTKLYTPTIKDADEKLKEICYSTAYEIYGNPLPQLVEERLLRELNNITKHGFGVIYYISYLLVAKSYQDGYVVGSRGSVGSSFVATMAKITEVNPLPPHYVCTNCHYNKFFLDGSVASGYDLDDKKCPNCNSQLKVDGQDIPFETFLGFEGDKVPDIDLNFSSLYQETAQEYAREIFGEDKIFKAGTVGTVAERSAFGYVLGYLEEMDLEEKSRTDMEVLAHKATGVKRTTGQHPGGLIVIPDDMDVYDFTPIQYPANNIYSNWKTTHFQYSDIEENVLKLDILGHVDPTAMKLLETISGIDVETIPLNDKKVMSIFNSTDALNIDDRYYHEKTGAIGLPEFGTPFVRRMLEATRPKTFSELLIISGLSHGTDVWANNAENLIKEGIPLNKLIGCRDDIMTNLIQQGLPNKASFDIMESVRKGRGLTDEWLGLMKEHNVDDWYIESCQKIKYMFPKAHAVAYVIMAVRVAYFKVYYPAYYYVSYFTLRAPAFEIESMTNGLDTVKNTLATIKNQLSSNEITASERNKFSRLVNTLEVTLEMYLRGYTMKNIDINLSQASQFIVDPNDDKAIIPPFNTIDGLGESVGESIVKAREKSPFISQEDLVSRTLVSKNILEKFRQLSIVDKLQESNQLTLF